MCWHVIGGAWMGSVDGGGPTSCLTWRRTVPPCRIGLPNLSKARTPIPKSCPARGGSDICGMRTCEWRKEKAPGRTMSGCSTTTRALRSSGGARSSVFAPAIGGLAGLFECCSAHSARWY